MAFLINENENRELSAAKSRLATALANPFDDRYNLAKEKQAVEWLESPSFCTGSTEEEINRAHEGDQSVFVYDVARQKSAKNPWQCESARLYDLQTDRWYRESPASLLKNIGAGVVNAIVPGSDLGDAGSSTQIVGQLIGSFASAFINPGKLIEKTVTSMSLGSTLTNAFNFVNKAFSGPVGSIATGYIGSLLNPTPVAPAVQAQLYTTRQPNNIADQAMSAAQAAIFGGSSSPSKLQVGGVTITQDKPWYKNPWVIGAGVIAVLLAVLALFNPFKKRRK